jgi:GAF domain-containing protein
MQNLQTILIAQGEPKLVSSLRSTIEQQGWAVLIARDALLAFHFAMKVKPNAVLLGSQLPGGGLFLLKRLREFVHTASIPVIAIVESDGPPKQDFLSAGALECVEHPVEIELLCEVIRKCVAEAPAVSEAPLDAICAPERLAALRQTGLLDSPPSESFDELTRLATKLIGTPVALMSLVDHDRQFFKSQIGLEEPWSTLRQTPVSQSFCQWVVTSQDELVIADARQHAGLLPNLALRDLGIVAYAGVPILALDGQLIGSFCAIDSRPRSWTEDDLAILRNLTRIAEGYTALERAQREKSQSNAPGSGIDFNYAIYLAIISSAISAVKAILQRAGSRIGETDRVRFHRLAEPFHRELEQSSLVQA